jgi:hypothetical protein
MSVALSLQLTTDNLRTIKMNETNFLVLLGLGIALMVLLLVLLLRKPRFETPSDLNARFGSNKGARAWYRPFHGMRAACSVLSSSYAPSRRQWQLPCWLQRALLTYNWNVPLVAIEESNDPKRCSSFNSNAPNALVSSVRPPRASSRVCASFSSMTDSSRVVL